MKRHTRIANTSIWSFLPAATAATVALLIAASGCRRVVDNPKPNTQSEPNVLANAQNDAPRASNFREERPTVYLDSEPPSNVSLLGQSWACSRSSEPPRVYHQTGFFFEANSEKKLVLVESEQNGKQTITLTLRINPAVFTKRLLEAYDSANNSDVLSGSFLPSFPEEFKVAIANPGFKHLSCEVPTINAGPSHSGMPSFPLSITGLTAAEAGALKAHLDSAALVFEIKADYRESRRDSSGSISGKSWSELFSQATARASGQGNGYMATFFQPAEKTGHVGLAINKDSLKNLFLKEKSSLELCIAFRDKVSQGDKDFILSKLQGTISDLKSVKETLI